MTMKDYSDKILGTHHLTSLEVFGFDKVEQDLLHADDFFISHQAQSVRILNHVVIGDYNDKFSS